MSNAYLKSYNPETDSEIAINFGIGDYKFGKAECKRNLRELFGLKKGSWPIIGVAAPFDKHSGYELLIPVADMLADSGFQLVLAGSGNESCEMFFTGLNLRRPSEAGVHIRYYREVERPIYAGCDVFLSLGKFRSIGCGHLKALRYGALPVVYEFSNTREDLRDPINGDGPGFTFCEYNPSALFDACIRAYDIYTVRDGWDDMVRRAILFAGRKADGCL